MAAADTAERLIDSYAYGKITWDKLVEKFTGLPMAKPNSMRSGRTWGDVYREAEIGDDTDIPQALYTAKFAGQITADQENQLLGIYRKRVPPG
jgi:hypothetical protein